MPTQPRIGFRSLALAAALAAAAPGLASAQDDPAAQTTQESVAPHCTNSCRGLGIEKVKAGEKHCGLISRERKDLSLDAACLLADSHRKELETMAEERAREKCDQQLDQTACRCQTELARWQNVYTHVFSQRCWTECGWAFLVECDRLPGTDEG